MSYKDPARAREYLRTWREKNREFVLQDALLRNRKLRKRNQEYVWEYKRKNPCTDCKKFFHPVAMDFDHTAENKFMGVANMARGIYSIERIEEEMKKCDLVCSNCHRVRTFERHHRLKA